MKHMGQVIRLTVRPLILRPLSTERECPQRHGVNMGVRSTVHTCTYIISEQGSILPVEPKLYRVDGRFDSYGVCYLT